MFLSVALVSCDKLSDDSRIKNGTIGFTRTKVTAVDTKAESGEAVLVGEVSSDDYSFAVTCSEGIITDMIDTKAEQKTASNLDAFYVHGFLGSEIDAMVGASAADKSNHHFINGAVASTTDHKLWHFNQEQKWRNGVNHTFWAYYPSTLDLEVSDDYSEAEFSYSHADFDTDILISNAERYYGKEEEDASTRNNALNLTFDHALAAVTANTNAVTFRQKKSDGTIVDAPDGRGEVVSVAARKLAKSGECTVSGSNIGWSVSGEETVTDEAFADNGLRFYLPQVKDDKVIVLTVKDNVRELVRPYIFNASTLLGSGNWETGKKYDYSIKGTVTVPYLEGGVTPVGIELNFDGKQFDSKIAVDNLDLSYVKTIKLTWKGIPTGSDANGTFGFLGITESNADAPTEADYMSGKNTAKKDNPNLLFIYNYWKNASVHCEKGSYVDGVCSCELDVPDGWTSLDIYAAYIGSNSSGTIKWSLRDFTIEVIAWK